MRYSSRGFCGVPTGQYFHAFPTGTLPTLYAMQIWTSPELYLCKIAKDMRIFIGRLFLPFVSSLSFFHKPQVPPNFTASSMLSSVLSLLLLCAWGTPASSTNSPAYGPLPNGSWLHPEHRSRTCYVRSHNDLITDDSPYILSALRDCNDGGHVIFPSNTNYLIGTALNLTFLRHVDLDIRGSILFTNDTDYVCRPMVYPASLRAWLILHDSGSGKHMHSSKSTRTPLLFSNSGVKT